MAGRLTHAEIEEVLGAYALDAVEPDEAAMVEAHLRECPRCASEVAGHREVAASLAHAGSPAPEGLWQRIAGALEEAPPALDLARVAPLKPRFHRAELRLTLGLVAAAAVLTGVLGVQVVRQQERIDDLTSVMRERALEQAAASASADARAQRVTLRSEDGNIYAEAVMQPTGSGYLVRHNLPRLPDDRTYQLWGRVGDRTVSLGVLGPDPRMAAFTADGTMTMVAISDEERGGATAPTRQPLLRGFLAGR